jgi:hypothetical protein
VKELPSDIQLIRLIFTLVGIFLLFFISLENTFSAPVDTLNLQLQWAYPINVTDMKLVDFNHDGISEILVGFKSDSSRVGILDAVSQSMVWQSPGLLGPVCAVAGGDRNNDGSLDIVCGGESADSNSGYVEILDGPGFNSPQSILGFDDYVSAVGLCVSCTDVGCELPVGTTFEYYWYNGSWDYGWGRSGHFFELNCGTLTYVDTVASGEVRIIDVSDIDRDGHDEIAYGAVENIVGHGGTWAAGASWVWISICFPESIRTIEAFYDSRVGNIPRAWFDAMTTGDCDHDNYVEIIVSYHVTYKSGETIRRLDSFEGTTGELEWTIVLDSNIVTGLAICNLLARTAGSVCVAYHNGLIKIKSGVDGNDLASSGQLPIINHFALGNVDGDSLIEMCIASDESLYIYETPSITTDVDQTEEYSHVENFCLFPNYPNPFNPETNIRFTIPIASEVTLRIYNILGEEVRTFQNHFKSGTHTLTWDGKNSFGEDVASGVYLYKLSAGNYQDTRKMVLIR